VTAEQGNDRRVQKTQRLLHDALVSLLHEKSYDSIVVREILARANVGRSAFYAHFHDKDGLLASGIHQMLQATPSRPLPPFARRFANIVWFSLPVLEYIDRFRHTANAKMGRRDRDVVHQHLRQVLIHQIADQVRAEVACPNAGRGDIPPDLLAEYVVATFILVLNWWGEGGSPRSPYEVDDLFLSMVVPTLVAVADGR
jgi:AcrR family transcriptional regulator